MACPADIKIKEERDDPEYDDKDLLQVNFDVDVKIENCALLGDVDWCTENAALLEEIDKQFKETSDEDLRRECELCGRHCSDSQSLLRHNLLHLRVMLVKSVIYECNICSVCYTQKDDLKDHIYKRHSESKKNSSKSGVPVTKSNHMCNICFKILPYKSWHGHMKDVHMNGVVQCPKCGKIFKTSRYLRRHKMYVHDGVTPHWRGNSKVDENLPCDVCKKKFHNQSALKVHKRNSHSTKQFQCYICKSVLKCKSYLMAHMRRVHYFDGKEHVCDICGKKFKSPRYVKVHIKNSHTKKKGKISKKTVKS